MMKLIDYNIIYLFHENASKLHFILLFFYCWNESLSRLYTCNKHGLWWLYEEILYAFKWTLVNLHVPHYRGEIHESSDICQISCPCGMYIYSNSLTKSTNTLFKTTTIFFVQIGNVAVTLKHKFGYLNVFSYNIRLNSFRLIITMVSAWT